MNKLINSKRFKSYMAGLFFDRVGNSIYSVIVPLLLFYKTQSLLMLTMASLSTMLPKVFSFFVVGPIVDGRNKRNLFFISLIIQSFSCFILGVITLMPSVSIAYYFLITIITSIAFEFSRSCERALVPKMFPNDIAKAISILATTFTVALILGPIFTTLFLKNNLYYIFLWFNAFTYLMPILLNYYSKIPQDNIISNFGSIKDITESLLCGFKYLLTNMDLKIILLSRFMISLATGGIGICVVFLLKNKFNLADNIVASLSVVEGIGMFFSSTISYKIRLDNGLQPIKISLVIMLLSILGINIPNYYIVIISYAFLSLSIFLGSLYFENFIQNNIDQNFNGRVGGLFRLSSQVGVTLSLLLIPLINSFNSNNIGFIYFSSLVVIITFALLVKFESGKKIL